MQISFDGARRTLVEQFNSLAGTQLDVEQAGILSEMRRTIVLFLAMYDPNDEGDSHCLSGDALLGDVPEVLDDEEDADHKP